LKETRGCTIYDNNKGSKSETTHNPGDKSKGEAYMNKSELKKIPTSPVKRFGEADHKND